MNEHPRHPPKIEELDDDDDFVAIEIGVTYFPPTQEKLAIFFAHHRAGKMVFRSRAQALALLVGLALATEPQRPGNSSRPRDLPRTRHQPQKTRPPLPTTRATQSLGSAALARN
jgi:hypothetical protein